MKVKHPREETISDTSEPKNTKVPVNKSLQKKKNPPDEEGEGGWEGEGQKPS